MKVTCKQIVEELCDYVDQALDSGERARFEEHLRRCRPCRIVCDTAQQTVHIYRHWPPVAVPPEVESRLFATLKERVYARYRCGA